jgi:hypothetical protein
MKPIVLTFLLAVTLFACKPAEEIDPNSEHPTIISLTSEKSEIKIGESTKITCEATGGNLEYEWSVLLGDIIPANESGSEVTYSGFECCSGEKTISCTVKNDKGTATDTLVVNILE